jgi:hypothetical protein
MADIAEAFNNFNNQNKTFDPIDYFFTQRTLKETHEYLDTNMNRKKKKISKIYNFLALSIPKSNFNQNKNGIIEIEVYGDNGYNYKGNIKSFQGIIPNFMIPLKEDKKIFIHIQYYESDENNNKSNINEYVSFIDVPKRFQENEEEIINNNQPLVI